MMSGDPAALRACARGEGRAGIWPGGSWWVVAMVGLALVLALGLGCRRGGGGGEAGAERIVTLTPSATELVAALGMADRLVAVDDYSTYPELVKGLPRVGSFLQPHLEAIIRVRPGVVIADDVHADVTRSLRDVGIEVVSAPMHSLPDLKVAFQTVGKRLGKDAEARGRARVEEIEAAIEAARRRGRGKGKRVLIVIDREAGGLGGMVAASTGSWLDELVAITGAENVMAGSPVRYPKLSPEAVLRSGADVVLDVSFTADAEAALAAWQAMPTVPAVREGRVRVLKAAVLLSPSPRVEEALALVEEAVGGE